MGTFYFDPADIAATEPVPDLSEPAIREDRFYAPASSKGPGVTNPGTDRRRTYPSVHAVDERRMKRHQSPEDGPEPARAPVQRGKMHCAR